MTAYDRQMEELVRRIEALEETCTQLTGLRHGPIEVKCTCGSGGHPRDCLKHPDRKELHALELSYEGLQDDVATLVRAARHVRQLLLSREFEAACIADRCHLGPALEPFDQVAK